MYELYCRTYQKVIQTTSRFLPWRLPKTLEGENCLKKLPQLIKDQGIQQLLIVTDKGITAIGLMDELLERLNSTGIQYVIYDSTVPNPTIDNIEEALQLYYDHRCEAIIGFGGGSPIDCAKGVAARVARPNKTIPDMRGLLKVRKSIPTLYAIPTTSGTGSEGTVATVISNKQTHEKYAIMDPVLIPHIAVLDPLLTIKLPPHITAATGMDALTHAVEAFIGRSNTPETRQWSIEATKLVFDNLTSAYRNGENLTARSQMQKAAYLAGLAFTRAYVGYVHAIAHTLGGFYNVPHGLANAIILPHVLAYYGDSVHKPLAELADIVGITETSDTEAEKANKFIEAIKKMNASMEIPEKVNGILNEDIPVMVERALKEANPLYPVPKILNKNDLFELYRIIKAE